MGHAPSPRPTRAHSWMHADQGGGHYETCRHASSPHQRTRSASRIRAALTCAAAYRVRRAPTPRAETSYDALLERLQPLRENEDVLKRLSASSFGRVADDRLQLGTGGAGRKRRLEHGNGRTCCYQSATITLMASRSFMAR
jgi:hypothetical protein